jgi:HK97 family phage major capsid protein
VERIETGVSTIAHITEPLDRSLLSDYEELVSLIDGQLRLGVLLREESQIINGNGTSPNLRGILNTTGIGTVTRGGTEARIEAIHRAITTCRASFYEPDAIVLHPTDSEELLFEKDANGQYIAANVSEQDPQTLWGKPVITSPVIAQNTGLVGAFGVGCVLYDREEARVDYTESGGFGTNSDEIFRGGRRGF